MAIHFLFLYSYIAADTEGRGEIRHRQTAVPRAPISVGGVPIPEAWGTLRKP